MAADMAKYSTFRLLDFKESKTLKTHTKAHIFRGRPTLKDFGTGRSANFMREPLRVNYREQCYTYYTKSILS